MYSRECRPEFDLISSKTPKLTNNRWYVSIKTRYGRTNFVIFKGFLKSFFEVFIYGLMILEREEGREEQRFVVSLSSPFIG